MYRQECIGITQVGIGRVPGGIAFLFVFVCFCRRKLGNKTDGWNAGQGYLFISFVRGRECTAFICMYIHVYMKYIVALVFFLYLFFLFYIFIFFFYMYISCTCLLFIYFICAGDVNAGYLFACMCIYMYIYIFCCIGVFFFYINFYIHL